MLALPEYIDVIVPRGGKGLVEFVADNARMPVIKHLDGVCHVYIDDDADREKAVAIAVNAKTQRYGTCNTMETLLLDAPVAEVLLPRLAAAYAELAPEHNAIFDAIKAEYERAVARKEALLEASERLGYAVETALLSNALTRNARPTFLLLLATARSSAPWAR